MSLELLSDGAVEVVTLLLLLLVVVVVVVDAVSAKFAEQYSVSCCRIVMKIRRCSMCAQSAIILSTDKFFFQTY
jgi:hypothetical protein